MKKNGFAELIQEIIDEGSVAFSRPNVIPGRRGTHFYRQYVVYGVQYTPTGYAVSLEAKVKFAEVADRAWNVEFDVDSPAYIDKSKYSVPIFRGISEIVAKFVTQFKPLRLMFAVDETDPVMRSKMGLYTRMVLKSLPSDFSYVYKTPQLFYVNKRGSAFDEVG